MQSRLIVVAKLAALTALVLIALAISVFLFNFLFFFVRINLFQGHLAVLPLLFFFPWSLLAIDIGLLLLAELLLQQFRFAYRRPVLYTLFALLALVIALGMALDRVSNFNEQMEDHARHGRLPPPMGEMYRHARHF